MAPTAKQRIMESNRVNALAASKLFENRIDQIRKELSLSDFDQTYPFDSVLLFARVEDLVEVRD